MHSDEDAKERICIGAKNKSLQVINSACMYNRTQNKTNKNKNAKKTQNPARKVKNVDFFSKTKRFKRKRRREFLKNDVNLAVVSIVNTSKNKHHGGIYRLSLE